METGDKFLISRSFAYVLKEAKEICGLMESRFSDAAQRSENWDTTYSFAKTAQSFHDAETLISSAIIMAKIHGEQDAFSDE